MEDCIFCKIAKKEIKVEIVEETENFLAFPDKNPKVPEHCLIIPKKHFVNLMDLPSALGEGLLDIIKKITEKKLKAGYEGFNIIVNNFLAAGQVVMHSHIHLLPRKRGDNYKEM